MSSTIWLNVATDNYRLFRLTRTAVVLEFLCAQINGGVIMLRVTASTAAMEVMVPLETTCWRSGQILAAKFKLVRELGRGGMGTVWEAEHLSLGTRVAIKLIAPEKSESTLGVVRFVREAKAAAALRSPHVVQMFDHGIDAGVPYIVMELLEGESLATRLARQGRLDEVATARVVNHISRALEKARERGIVHRDLKPANVFVVRDGGAEVVKVLDFGVAKEVITSDESAYQTKTGTVVGTPKYMSPEQARGRQVDWRADVWSLAVIAYQCHVGEVPFQGVALGELLLQICSDPLPRPSEHAQVADGFDDWWLRAANRTPTERFRSVREMAKALEQVLLAPAARPSRPSKPRWRWLAAGVAVTLAVTVLWGYPSVPLAAPKPIAGALATSVLTKLQSMTVQIRTDIPATSSTSAVDVDIKHVAAASTSVTTAASAISRSNRYPSAANLLPNRPLSAKPHTDAGTAASASASTSAGPTGATMKPTFE